MELTGTYRHTYMRDLQTRYTKFSFLPLEEVDGIDQYGNILCMGKIPLYSKGMPLKIRCNRRQTSSGHTYFILECVEEYVAHDALLKQFLITSFDGLNEKKTDAILIPGRIFLLLLPEKMLPSSLRNM